MWSEAGGNIIRIFGQREMGESSARTWPIIRKSPQDRARANLTDYDTAVATFSWAAAQKELGGLPDGALNIAYEALDRQIELGRGEQVALRWIGRDDRVVEFTYARLTAQANRFANLLRALDVRPGGRIFSLLGRTPELYFAALGSLKAGCVFTPLFSAFGPEPIRARMEIGQADVLVTSEALYRRKVEAWRGEIASLRHVLLADSPTPPAGTRALEPALAAADPRSATAPTRPEGLALLHFTSGTTGRPKGAMHVHEAVVAHHITGRTALDLRPGDTYWCTADPGWVTGTSYGIISPLTNGVTLVVDEAEFDAERWRRILAEQRVQVWYTAPTAIRMLMKAWGQDPRPYEAPDLRFMASVGEPLNPEAVTWGVEAFGRPFHDNWWQTETGGIMIANFASMDIKPGSMGRPLPGVVAGIVERDAEGAVWEISRPMAMGELALRPGWPSIMRGYLHEDERFRKCFAGGWYLTGDLAMRDADGYFWFVGRADDVIKSAGHLIGPFEVESALMEHAAVAEAAVIGLPDPVAGETVKAYVALKAGFQAGENLRRELLGHARKRLGAAIAPKDIAFRQNLPKTRSGKIMRRLLKARELGLPEGDLSTLESEER
jgi:acetyl-CoA synthetase